MTYSGLEDFSEKIPTQEAKKADHITQPLSVFTSKGSMKSINLLFSIGKKCHYYYKMLIFEN